MYRTTRKWHRAIGIVVAIFLLTIAVTGFLLATKGTFGWVRPPELKGAPLGTLGEVVSVDQAARAAFDLGIPELRSHEDIDRIDYRPGKNHFKILSKRGYHEVQVDGATGKVLQVARRNDQLAEDIHDLSYFAEWLHAYWLPAVAAVLFFLAASGICMFFVPVLRRAKYNRTHPKEPEIPGVGR